MSATELAALIVAISSVVAVTLLVFGLISITRTLKEVRLAVQLLRTEALPVIDDLNDTVRAANYELDRVESLLGTAESIGGVVDSASRLAYTAFSNPVIKGAALASGTGRAAKSFRRRRGS